MKLNSLKIKEDDSKGYLFPFMLQLRVSVVSLHTSKLNLSLRINQSQVMYTMKEFIKKKIRVTLKFILNKLKPRIM